MTTVTSLTADRMLAIEAASVIDGDVDGSGNLILTKHDGSQINAGSVIGPTGPQGPVGSDLVVASAVPVLDVGLVGQIRAGRQLTPADFTNIGLSAPLGLWNLSDLSDVSGNGRNLLNKGAVPFASGINGVAITAAQFVGSTAQALYIPDDASGTLPGAAFRIRTGSFGCWFKTAKRGADQMLLSKLSVSGQYCWRLFIGSANVIQVSIAPDGTTITQVNGVSDIADDRWHFAVATVDATMLRIYVDGILETAVSATYMYGGSSVFNIGAAGADASTAAGNPHFGRIDEAFVTADVLSEDQVRNLYCAKILHTLAVVPSRASLNVRRRRRGATLVAADFSTQPLRLHNFSGGSLGDEGSGGVALTNNGGALSVGSVDGISGNAFMFLSAFNQSLSSTDAGLPAALATRSYGCWFKTTSTAGIGIMSWGTDASVQAMLNANTPGNLFATSGGDAIAGPFVLDGQWHHAVVVEDNGALDGIKRKLYLDGRLVGSSIVMNSLVSGGTNAFRVGARPQGSQPFTGQIDAAFVCGYALTFEQIATLYAKGSQALAPSPKNVGDHVEAMSSSNLLATFDTLESQHQVDLRVAA
jgi:Concanavalin A-like lectin/glucanases superfamily